MMNIGILALQGSVIEHRRCLEQLDGVNVVEVKTVSALNSLDGIILPGGESTTIGKLLREFGLFDPLKTKIQAGLPVWGTCAGLILLAKKIVHEDYCHLGVMDIVVRRNAYGNQLDSFVDTVSVPEVSPHPFPAVFIRAPWIENVGDEVKVLLNLRGHIVMAREKHMLVTSFHPELTNDSSVHQYFIRMIEETNQ